MNWCFRVGECQLQLRLASRYSVWQVCLLLFDRNIAPAEEQSSQLCTSEFCRPKVAPGSYQNVEFVPLIFHRERFNRAGLATEKFRGRLAGAVEIHYSVDPLLQRT